MTARLVYLLNVSLDGITATPNEGPSWATVDDEIHTWFNEQMRGMDATLYGRRMYETMAAYWPTGEDDPDGTETTREFARIWNPLPKIVFSNSLERVDHNSRLVRGDVQPVLDEVRREFDGEVGVSGPDLAGQFVQRGLVDEYRLVVHPVVLGAGTPYWPQLEQPLRLRLVERHPFASGTEVRTYVPA
jgi:dihydrofolate reductase